MHLDASNWELWVELIVAPTLGRAYRPLRGGAGGGGDGAEADNEEEVGQIGELLGEIEARTREVQQAMEQQQQ